MTLKSHFYDADIPKYSEKNRSRTLRANLEIDNDPCILKEKWRILSDTAKYLSEAFEDGYLKCAASVSNRELVT